MQDAVVAAAAVDEHVVADQPFQRGVPRQRSGVEQHRGRRRRHRPGRHAGRQPRDRPEEQRQEALQGHATATIITLRFTQQHENAVRTTCSPWEITQAVIDEACVAGVYIYTYIYK